MWEISELEQWREGDTVVGVPKGLLAALQVAEERGLRQNQLSWAEPLLYPSPVYKVYNVCICSFSVWKCLRFDQFEGSLSNHTCIILLQLLMWGATMTWEAREPRRE